MSWDSSVRTAHSCAANESLTGTDVAGGIVRKSWFKRLWNRFRPSDKLTLAYTLASALPLIVYVPRTCKNTPPRIPKSWLVAAHLLGLGGMLTLLPLTANSRSRPVVFARHWYPALVVPLLFKELFYLVPAVNPNNVDRTLLAWERALLGVQPTLWLEKHMTPLLTDVLSLAYAAYYLLPTLPAATLYWRGQHKEFDRFVFLLLLNFYTAFSIYFVMPAVGPKVTLKRFYKKKFGDGTAFSRYVERVVDYVETEQRDCFPSLHTQIATVVALYMIGQQDPRLPMVLPLSMAMILSTVYCRYHYVPDLIAGIIVAASTLKMYRQLHGATDGQPESGAGA